MPTLVPLTSYQYEAGSCTLKLMGQLSALSQLSDRPVLKRSRFQIQLWHGAGVPPEPTTTAAGQPILELSGREPQLSELADVVQRYVQTYLRSEAITPVQAVSRGETSLALVGPTRHRLELAGLDTATRSYTVELSTVQLADLAEVLEQAARAVECLPEADLPKTSGRTRPRLPLWVGSVAAVAVAAVLGSQWLTRAPVTVRSPAPNAATAPDAESFTLEGGQEQTATVPPDGNSQPVEATPEASSPDQAATPPASPVAPDAPLSTDRNDPAATPGQPSPGAAPPSSTSARPEQPLEPDSDAPVAPSGRTTPGNPAPATTSELPDIAAGSAPGENAGQPSAPEAMAGARTNAATIEAAPATTDPITAEWLERLTTALQEQWHPPVGLVAPLSYRLTLAADGTVNELQPLTELARSYQTQSSLPHVGQVFPNLTRHQPVTVDVQFMPSGEVIVSPSPAGEPPQE